jgi:hypothetical protein
MQNAETDPSGFGISIKVRGGSRTVRFQVNWIVSRQLGVRLHAQDEHRGLRVDVERRSHRLGPRGPRRGDHLAADGAQRGQKLRDRNVRCGGESRQNFRTERE